MTYSKTGNKKERKPVPANDSPNQGERRSGFPHFFVVGRLTASFASGRWQPGEPCFKSKVSFHGRVSHPIPQSWKWKGFIPKYTPGISEKVNRVSLTESGQFSPVFSASGSRCRCPWNQLFYWTPDTGSLTYSIISPGWQSRISHSWIMVSTVTLRLFTRLSTVLGLIL